MSTLGRHNFIALNGIVEHLTKFSRPPLATHEIENKLFFNGSVFCNKYRLVHHCYHSVLVLRVSFEINVSGENVNAHINMRLRYVTV